MSFERIKKERSWTSRYPLLVTRYQNYSGNRQPVTGNINLFHYLFNASRYFPAMVRPAKPKASAKAKTTPVMKMV